MADEVYQDNVYSKDKSFVSFKKVIDIHLQCVTAESNCHVDISLHSAVQPLHRSSMIFPLSFVRNQSHTRSSSHSSLEGTVCVIFDRSILYVLSHHSADLDPSSFSSTGNTAIEAQYFLSICIPGLEGLGRGVQ